MKYQIWSEDIPILTLQEEISLEGKITLGEISAALKIMKKNKSPESDGFTVDFLKFCCCYCYSWLLLLLNY